MSLVQGKGSEITFGGNVDLKEVFIRLKPNESVKVKLLSATDYVEYKAHGSFSHKIYTQPCVAPTGKDCPLCIASKSGVEGFDALYQKKRYLFAFGDITTGKLRVWECSKSQAKDLVAQIEEYKDDLEDSIFNFKRTGTKTETSYKLNLISDKKLTADDRAKMEEFAGETVPDSFYEEVLVPRSEKLMLDILDEAGFPVTQYYPEYVRESTETPTATTADGDDSEVQAF